MEEDRKTLQEAIVDSRMKRNYFEQERVRGLLLAFREFAHRARSAADARVHSRCPIIQSEFNVAHFLFCVGMFFSLSLARARSQDMVQQFYDIVHQDVVDTQAKVRNTESEMERMQDAHRNDIRVRRRA
jgi:hypothetical protein